MDAIDPSGESSLQVEGIYFVYNALGGPEIYESIGSGFVA